MHIASSDPCFQDLRRRNYRAITRYFHVPRYEKSFSVIEFLATMPCPSSFSRSTTSLLSHKCKTGLCCTTIQRDTLPVDPFAFLASQEANNPSNIDREPVPSQGRRMSGHLSNVSNATAHHQHGDKPTCCRSSAVYFSPPGM